MSLSSHVPSMEAVAWHVGLAVVCTRIVSTPTRKFGNSIMLCTITLYSRPFYYSAHLVKWVTENNWPANIINDRELCDLLTAGRPTIQLPSHKTISREIKSSFEKCRERVAKLLQERRGHLHFANRFLDVSESSRVCGLDSSLSTMGDVVLVSVLEVIQYLYIYAIHWCFLIYRGIKRQRSSSLKTQQASRPWSPPWINWMTTSIQAQRSRSIPQSKHRWSSLGRKSIGITGWRTLRHHTAFQWVSNCLPLL